MLDVGLKQIPIDIQRDYGALLEPAERIETGSFRLTDIRRSLGDYEDQRVSCYVVDENGMAMANVNVAFAFSTANNFYLDDDFKWLPPRPYRAFITQTDGAGKAEMILGAEGVVKSGDVGGVTCYVFEPEYSSDIVTGLGMLADHTGLVLTFQLQRAGVVPFNQRLAAIEQRLEALEAKIER
jgi:hypothetical protein